MVTAHENTRQLSDGDRKGDTSVATLMQFICWQAEGESKFKVAMGGKENDSGKSVAA